MQKAENENPKGGCILLRVFQCHLLIKKHLREYLVLPELWASVRTQGLLLEPGEEQEQAVPSVCLEGFLREMAS